MENTELKLTTNFILPVILVIFLDSLFTIIGQPKGYWTKGFKLVNEGSFSGFYLLQLSPFVFLAFMAVYAGLAFFLLKKLPLFWSIALGLSLFTGHIYGSSSWVFILYQRLNLPNFPFANWVITVCYIVLMCLITSIIITRKLNKENLFSP